ncbi:hypothetical protein, partial [Acinetobacter baumannii]|uniref:hypothetical protein n=2 Tax=Acinetobacter baumannii TaxID=470 RepID=UPI001BB46A53
KQKSAPTFVDTLDLQKGKCYSKTDTGFVFRIQNNPLGHSLGEGLEKSLFGQKMTQTVRYMGMHRFLAFFDFFYFCREVSQMLFLA